MNSRKERFSKLAPLLKRLKRNVGKKFSNIIRKCDNDLICSLLECFHSFLKGNVPLTLTQKVKLRRHKHNIRKLSVKKTCIKQRKKILQRGGFLGASITPILSVLGISSMEHAKKMVLVDWRVRLKKRMFTNTKSCWKRVTLVQYRRR